MAEEILLTAALSGLGLADLAELAGEIYARAPKTPASCCVSSTTR
jgi:hypothetical protein